MMVDKTKVLKMIGETCIIPVIRTKSKEEAEIAIEAVLAGGINVVEITMTTPGACDLIKEFARKLSDDALIGAGTVLDVETAKKCVGAGAKFIISPMFEPETIAFCNDAQIAVMPGALTPAEIYNARRSGADMVKVFPVSAMGGAAYLKAVRSVFPDIEMIPTGGVNINNFTEYLDAGAFAVGIGSDLTGGSSAEITSRVRVLRAQMGKA